MRIFNFLKERLKPNDEKADKARAIHSDDFKSHLDGIQKEVFLFLKPLGFKKKGRSFNRETEDGLYQVINIQSGKYEFGDKYVIPGLKENYYGKFTVNLGVMVKEIYELDPHNRLKDIYQDYHCQIRTRLTTLTIKQDHCWLISEDNQKIANEVIEGLISHGIPWLNLFESRTEICSNWGIVEGSSLRAKLDVALIVLNEDKKKGTKLIQDYYDNIETHKGHKEYVKELANQLGIRIDR